jgi:hypothetical protein
MIVLVLNFSCSKESYEKDDLLDLYISASNKHDITELANLLDDDAVWHLGGDTLAGKEEVLGPLKFDAAVNTEIYVLNRKYMGDTIDFDLIEKNQVLYGLGIDSLTHYARFIYSKDKIKLKTVRRPPEPFQAFSDSVSSFLHWLKLTDSLKYNEMISINGKFKYNFNTGRIMLEEIPKWTKR